MKGRQPITIARLRAAGKKVGLTLDETQYRGKDVPHRFICVASGHVRMMSPGNIIYRGARCAQCLQPLRERGIGMAQQLAANAGGRCLSAQYRTVTEKLLWQCQDGHRWRTSLSIVAGGSWCPECNKTSLSERQCRAGLEQLLGSSFPKAHPSWLLPPGAKRPLELDGFSHSLGVAFEYHGGQHYRIIPKLSGSKARLETIQSRDRLRRTLCRKQGVVLIEIPEFKTTDLAARAEQIRETAIQALSRAGRNVAPELRTKPLDVSSAFLSTLLRRMEEQAASRGGRCVTRAFRGWHRNVEWECACGHRWAATPTSILHANTWCPVCAGQVGPTIAKLAGVATARGWILLSTHYVNAKTKLRWQCPKGHVVLISSDNFQRGKGCVACKTQNAGSTQRHGIEDAKRHARKRGGLCLSGTYRNSQSKLRWRCSRGHEWNATWASVARGSWCGQCHLLDRARRPRRATAASVEN